MTTRQRFLVWEQDVEDLHDGFVWSDTINLEHEVVHVAHILHPATREQVWLLDVLVGFHAENLDTLKEIYELNLVVADVVRQGCLFLHEPLACWTKRFLRWDDLSRLLIIVRESYRPRFFRLLHSFLVDLAEVLLFLWLCMLVGLIVGRWQICHLLDGFWLAFNHQTVDVCLSRLELVVRTVNDDHLSNLVSRGQVHGCLLLKVFEASSCAILDQ